jgi:kynureninase
VTGGVRLKAASVYHTSAHYRNFEEYEDTVLQPLNITLETSVTFSSDLNAVSGKEVTLQKLFLYLLESTEMHFKPHVFM